MFGYIALYGWRCLLIGWFLSLVFVCCLLFAWVLVFVILYICSLIVLLAYLIVAVDSLYCVLQVVLLLWLFCDCYWFRWWCVALMLNTCLMRRCEVPAVYLFLIGCLLGCVDMICVLLDGYLVVILVYFIDSRFVCYEWLTFVCIYFYGICYLVICLICCWWLWPCLLFVCFDGCVGLWLAWRCLLMLL